MHPFRAAALFAGVFLSLGSFTIGFGQDLNLDQKLSRLSRALSPRNDVQLRINANAIRRAVPSALATPPAPDSHGSGAQVYSALSADDDASAPQPVLPATSQPPLAIDAATRDRLLANYVTLAGNLKAMVAAKADIRSIDAGARAIRDFLGQLQVIGQAGETDAGRKALRLALVRPPAWRPSQ